MLVPDDRSIERYEGRVLGRGVVVGGIEAEAHSATVNERFV